MKRKLSTGKKLAVILALVLLIGGVGVYSYPRVHQAQYARHAREVIADFDERMETHRTESPDGSLDWLYYLMREYNERLYQTGQSGISDPWAYEQVSFSLIEFGFDEEMIGHIYIPRMDVTLPIYLGASNANLARGAAHMTNTSLPVGGNNTNSVIAAHRGWARARFFRNIHTLQYGDDVFITNFRETLQYRVVQRRIIRPHEGEHILIQSGRDLVTLLTCHPLGNNTHRYLVYAERVG